MAQRPVKSQNRPVAWGVYERVFRPWMRRRLNVLCEGPNHPVPQGRAILLCANHTSWWDGFVMREVHQRVQPDSALWTIMLERELRRFRVFAQIGGIGIEPGSTGSMRRLLRSLRHIGAESRSACVSFFPQGRIGSVTQRPLGFRRGVELVARALAPAAVVPVGIHIQPGARTPRSIAYVAIGDPLPGDGSSLDAGELEERVTGLLDRIREFTDEQGEDAEQRWGQR